MTTLMMTHRLNQFDGERIDPPLTLKEAAYLLRMTYRTSRRRVASREPPFDQAFREGGRWLIPKSAVMRMIRER